MVTYKFNKDDRVYHNVFGNGTIKDKLPSFSGDPYYAVKFYNEKTKKYQSWYEAIRCHENSLSKIK